MLKDLLKVARRNAGFTQDDVALHLNVKRQTYSAYERGASVPDALTLFKLADYFNVTADYLLTGKELHVQSEEIKELIENFEVLDKKGKTLVMAEVYRQLERCTAEVYVIAELAQGRIPPLTRKEAMKRKSNSDE